MSDPGSLTPRRAGRLVRRSLAVVFGILLLLAGLSMMSMCGPNRHIGGALTGALGGVVIALVRKGRRVLWFAVGGGVAGAALITALMAVLHDDCGDILLSLVSGIGIGAGIGLLADAVRASRTGNGG